MPPSGVKDAFTFQMLALLMEHVGWLGTALEGLSAANGLRRWPGADVGAMETVTNGYKWVQLFIYPANHSFPN